LRVMARRTRPAQVRRGLRLCPDSIDLAGDEAVINVPEWVTHPAIRGRGVI